MLRSMPPSAMVMPLRAGRALAAPRPLLWRGCHGVQPVTVPKGGLDQCAPSALTSVRLLDLVPAAPGTEEDVLGAHSGVVAVVRPLLAKVVCERDRRGDGRVEGAPERARPPRLGVLGVGLHPSAVEVAVFLGPHPYLLEQTTKPVVLNVSAQIGAGGGGDGAAVVPLGGGGV